MFSQSTAKPWNRDESGEIVRCSRSWVMHKVSTVINPCTTHMKTTSNKESTTKAPIDIRTKDEAKTFSHACSAVSLVVRSESCFVMLALT